MSACTGGVVEAQRIRAAAPVDGFGDRSPGDVRIDDVVGSVAPERVGGGRAEDVLDRRKGVALRGPPGADAEEVDHDPRRRVVVVDPVEAAAAGQLIGPEAADEDIEAVIAVDDVVAVAALDAIVADVAGESVAAAGTDQVLEAAAAAHVVFERLRHDDVVGGGAWDEHGQPENPLLGRAEIDRHGAAHMLVAQGVDARTAVQRVAVRSAIDEVVAEIAADKVRAAPSFENVVAVVADENVGAGIAEQRVGIDRSFDRLDAEQPVALGVAAALNRALQVDIDRAPGGDIGRAVVAGARRVRRRR